MITMKEDEFRQLVCHLAKSKSCCGNNECQKDITTYNEELDCINCWRKELLKIIKIY